jgi:hypothetical protein
MAGSDICRMRCQRCRMWIDVPRTAKKVPPHKVKYTNDQCTGGNQPPAEKIGPFPK